MQQAPSIDLPGFAAALRITDIRVLAQGHGRLARDIQTLHRIRGAAGHVLHDGASKAAQAGQPCTFIPRCAYDVFHNDRPGLKPGQVLQKPFVWQADDVGGDLLVTLRLFGDGDIWAGEFQAALVAGFRRGIDGTGALAVQGSDRQVRWLPPVPLDCAAMMMAAITPVVQRREKDTAGREPAPDQPHTAPLFLRMVDRLAELAQWQGLRLDHDREALRRRLQAVGTLGQWDALQPALFSRGGGPNNRRKRTGFLGTLTVPNPGADLATLIWLAGVAHIGGDTAAGAGRVAVSVVG